MQLKAVDIAREPIKLGRDRTVYDVRNVMVKYNIGRVIIVDNHNKALGIILSFLDADASWDTPRPHTINIEDSTSGNVIYTTGKLGYTNNSQPTTLPVGKYNVIDTKYPWMKGAITVTDQKTNGNLVMGGFYTPTK